MLNVLRESFKQSPYLKWVLGAVAVSFVLFLGNFFFGPGNGTVSGAWVARVNGKDIPQTRFRDVATRLDQYYRELFGENFEQLRPQIGIREQALQAVIEKELIVQDARRLGIDTTPAELAEQIRTIFRDQTGEFVGKERYEDWVVRNGFGSPAAYERILAEDLLTEKWTEVMTQPVDVSDAELEEVFRRRTEKTAVDYFVVASADQQVDTDATDGELREWYESHLDDYGREEGRRVRYLRITREAQMAGVDVSEEQIREYYDANQSLYAHPEQRRARHILLRLGPDAGEDERQSARGQAEELRGRIEAGEDFAALARANSQDPDTAEAGGDLGFFARGDRFAGFEEAVFSTAVGALAPITETPHGIHLIEVTDTREPGVAPLDDVREDIRRLLALRGADERLEAEATRLHEAIRAADDLEAVAQREDLAVRSGLVTAGEGPADLGATPDVLALVAGMQAGEVSAPLRTAAGKAIVVVDEVVQPGPAPFEDVKTSVQTDLHDDRARRAALERARDALDRAADLAAAAQALGRDVQSSGDLAPGQALPATGGASEEMGAALFGAGAQVGDRGAVPVPAGALVYAITRREPFDPSRFAASRADLRNETLARRRDAYRQSILDNLRAQQTIEVNRPWLESLGG